MKGRLFRKVLAGLLGLALLLGLASVLFLPGWIRGRLARLAVPVQSDSARWAWPIGVELRGITVPHPEDPRRPRLLQAERILLRIPWWGLFLRPIPVKLEMERPHVILDVLYGDALLARVQFLPMGPAWEQEADTGEPAGDGQAGPVNWEAVLRRLPFVPFGLRIRHGRLDLLGVERKIEKPLFVLEKIAARVELASAVPAPMVEGSLKGTFVTPQGEPVGFLDAETRARAGLAWMQGRLQVWYGRLEHFRDIYRGAPEPLTFEGGAGGPVIEWAFNEGEVELSIRCLTEKLRMGGTTSGVPWQRVLRCLEDEEGKIDLKVSTRARLEEPDLDLHNRLLSALDWAIRERAAAAGIRLPGRIFYALEAGVPEAAKPEPAEPEK